MDYLEQRKRLDKLTYTEMRWWMTDYAPFDRVLQYRIVTQKGNTKHIIAPWMNVPMENIP